jgi:UDP-N-acetylmuramate dehydrogenase
MNIRCALESVPNVEFLFDEPMARHTTFRVGGPVRALARPRSGQALCALLKPLRDLGLPFFVLGGGSNVLACDGAFEAAAIQLSIACDELLRSAQGEQQQTVLRAGAGLKLRDLIGYCIENNLQGLELLAGIPGTVGGALVMNAGTSARSISDAVIRIDILDADGVRRSILKEELTPGYRTMGIPEGSVVLGACFGLETCPGDFLKSRVAGILQNRRRNQPLRYPSAGSVFKNPRGQFAGALIEKAGLKGYRIGDAEVSRKHANWIVNRGGASARDILDLILKIENEIFATFGVRLEREIRILHQL